MIESKQIPWRKILTEGAVIVVSILLAFAIDAWWNEQIEREQERESLLSMRDEFQTSIEGLENIFNVVILNAKNIELLIEQLKTVKLGESIQVDAKIMGSLIMWRTTDVSTSTLTALMSSGSLNQLTNPELRSQLAGFPAILLDMTEDEVLTQQFAENIMSVYLVNSGLAEIAYANRGGSEELRTVFSTAPTEIMVQHTEELIGLLSARRVHFWFSEMNIPLTKAYLENLITLIDEELNQ